MSRPVMARELAVLRLQLGRTDAYADAVTVHCRLGHPAVVHNRPAPGRAPNPTLFWLTCPWLKYLIDRLEAEQRVKELEARLRRDGALAARFRAEQAAYNGFLRRTASGDGLPADARDRFAGLHIGGAADPLAVKCLHAHAAARLSGFATCAGDLALDETRRENPDAYDFILGRVSACA